jgi:hypothetical protein
VHDCAYLVLLLRRGQAALIVQYDDFREKRREGRENETGEERDATRLMVQDKGEERASRGNGLQLRSGNSKV